MLLLRNYTICLKCLGQPIKNLHLKRPQLNRIKLRENDENEASKIIDKYKEKLIYNTYINKVSPPLNHVMRHRLRMKEKVDQRKIALMEPLPVTLRYAMSAAEVKEPLQTTPSEVDSTITNFPFGQKGETPIQEAVKETELNYNPADAAEHEVKARQDMYKEQEVSTWMMDYENFDDDEEVLQLPKWTINYGTPDPNSKISKVPCGGCGAFLHCKDSAIPGYIPSEIYKNSFTREGIELKAMVCQRCHFLKNYNMALQVRVSSDDYPKVLETVKNKKALIVLMVDLLDFPCSIWPGIIDTLGSNKPIIVVGNKVDLLPRDSKGYLERITETLRENVQELVGRKTPNIKHVSLVSAKTGWGIEELITKIHSTWGSRGDVYLVGCTNVGKSSLFNCLLQSDLCKIQAVDLVQRATTSVWPGTTLNLLKFPILRPSGWRLYVRTKRLKSMQRIRAAEAKMNKIQLQETRDPKYATLIGHLDRTFSLEPTNEAHDLFAVEGNSNSSGKLRIGINEKDPTFAGSKWCYDTPGVVQPDQIIHLLTTEELMETLPRDIIKPKTFSLRQQQTLFIAGLARVDYVEGPYGIRVTVFCAENLPVTICKTEEAEQLYNELLNTDFLVIPKGSEERIKSWPGLKAGNIIEVRSKSEHQSCGDIVLSSAGWVSICGEAKPKMSFQAWTPEARGIYLRKPILPFAVNLRGKRIRRTPEYENNKVFVPI